MAELSSLIVFTNKEELKYMNDNEFGVSGSLRPNLTQMTISNNTMVDLLPKVILKKMTLTTKRSFLLSRKNDSLKIIMALVAHYDLELYQMDVKTVFLKVRI